LGGITCATAGCQVSVIDSIVSGNVGHGVGATVFPGETASYTFVRATVRDNGRYGIAVPGGSLSLTESSVSGNEEGGIVFLNQRFGSTVQISRSNVVGNHGGGIRVLGAALVISDSIVSGNDGGGGIDVNAGIFGEGPLIMANTTVTGNTAAGDGGGIWSSGGTITNSTISGNTAGRNGGGIYRAYSYVLGGSFFNNLEVIDSTVSGNTASSGGGIFNDTMVGPGTVTLSGTNTFSNNIPDDCVGVTGC
jgi:hypothetical protein